MGELEDVALKLSGLVEWEFLRARLRILRARTVVRSPGPAASADRYHRALVFGTETQVPSVREYSRQ